jgi:polysaccharide export outer membrane protein
MTSLITRVLLLGAALAAVVPVASWAQVPAPLPTTVPGMPSTTQRPTTEQAQAALQNPEIVAMVRARLLNSGLTPDQIRARLKAAGYPEDMLDAYLPGNTGPANAPSPEAMDALRRLGLVEQAAQQTQPTAALSNAAADSLLLQRRIDSLKGVAMHSNVFGLDIFRSSTSRFDPLSAGPVDVNYKVGPRDVLAVILTGGVETSYTLEVSPEGFVVIPQVGQVYVANLTLDQIRNVLYSRLGRVYSGLGRSPNASTQLSVSVARVRANQIFVIGEAVAPGSYQVSSAGTMLTALYSAGGPSENGGMRNIELRRGPTVVGTFDLYDYLVRGDASRDMRLESGDVLFVPFHGTRATIKGEVGRPAIFELKRGETLRDLITFAGGFTPNAARHRIQIRRILAPQARAAQGMERIVLDIPADQLIGGDVPPFPIEPGDQVQVFAVTEVERNEIVVTGHVWAPGELGLQRGMKVSDALRAVGGVRPGVYIGQVLISRKPPGEPPVQLRTSFVDSTGRIVNDVPLMEGDSVRVFSREEFSEVRSVGIAGAVRKAGPIPFREGMTLRDAVLQAGGVTEAAYLREAEVARVISTPTGSSAETFRVALDSTYLFERTPDGRYLGPPGVPVPSARVPEVVLRPYDQVLILRQPGWDLSRRVRVTGEVLFPGTYTLNSRNERYADLIRRAGGVTPQGYAQGAVFVRKDANLGRIDVNLASALSDPRLPDNLELLDGDSIFVPRYSPVVRVSGAVSSPSSITYVAGRSLNYYVDAAGGPLANGDRDRSYVVQPNGTRELYRHRWGIIPDAVPTPEAGAEVVVPLKPESHSDWTQTLVPLTQALTALATFIYVISR